MAVISGFVTRAPDVQIDNPNLPPELFEIAAIDTQRGYSASIEPSVSFDALAVAAPSRVIDAELNRTYRDDFYDRIHVTPSLLALGGLLSSQVREVRVWNAYVASRTLNSVTAADAEGLTLDAPADPPTTFAPLESRTYRVHISSDGPPTIDAVYAFAFGAETPELRVTGTRIIVFAFPPNWKAPVTERLEWLTDILPAAGGKEQRVSLRSIPRRSFSYQLFAGFSDAARLDALLWDWQSRVYALPVWTDPQRLTNALAAGAESIPLDTDGYDYHQGGLAVLIASPGTFEAVEISTIDTTGVSLVRPTGADWPAGTLIYPARLARLPAQVSVTRPSAAYAQAQVQFAVQDNTSAVAAAEQSTDTYRDAPVWHRQPNRRDPVTESYLRTIATLDNQTGVVTVDDLSDRATDQFAWSYLGRDRADIAALRSWLYARAGRLAPFWTPIWRRDLELVAQVVSGTAELTIRDIGYRIYNLGRPGRQDIALLHRDGTWYYRRITAAVAGTNGQEILSLDADLGITADPADFRIVSYMILARLAGDAIEIAWRSAGVAEVSIPIRSVLQ